ncbi:MAG: low molecular weight protein-tyrosine-phosphatase [Acetobacterales bacterium]
MTTAPGAPARPVGVLFICSGNICRSPMAAGLLRALASEAGVAELLRIDSAGTHGFHRGEMPDPRAQRVMAARGIDIARQRARMVAAHDFDRFDHILAMTREQIAQLHAIYPPHRRSRIALLLDHAPQQLSRDVPDPYYGPPEGFDRALALIDAGCRGLLARLMAEAPIQPGPLT